MNSKLYSALAHLLCARQNCIERNNAEWPPKHEQSILELVKQYMPSGSGVDCGTKIDLDKSTPNKLVFHFSYHHMNSDGMYDGWTDHSAIVTPSLAFGFDLKITGQNRDDIKEYLYETFREALNTDTTTDS